MNQSFIANSYFTPFRNHAFNIISIPFSPKHLLKCTVFISKKKLKNILICLMLIYCKKKKQELGAAANCLTYIYGMYVCPSYSLFLARFQVISLLRMKRKKFPLKFKVKKSLQIAVWKERKKELHFLIMQHSRNLCSEFIAKKGKPRNGKERV